MECDTNFRRLGHHHLQESINLCSAWYSMMHVAQIEKVQPGELFEGGGGAPRSVGCCEKDAKTCGEVTQPSTGSTISSLASSRQEPREAQGLLKLGSWNDSSVKSVEVSKGRVKIQLASVRFRFQFPGHLVDQCASFFCKGCL